MTKLEELEKKKKRLAQEAEKAEEQLKKYQEAARNKRQELKRVEADIIAEAMVQSGMSVDELKELILLKPDTREGV